MTQPRMPCYKFGVKFGRSDMVNKFLLSERTGFYLAVLQKGEVESAIGLNGSQKINAE
ncbi:MAG: MOSC domain-containing protein [Candidatus Binatia bacterium]